MAGSSNGKGGSAVSAGMRRGSSFGSVQIRMHDSLPHRTEIVHDADFAHGDLNMRLIEQKSFRTVLRAKCERRTDAARSELLTRRQHSQRVQDTAIASNPAERVHRHVIVCNDDRSSRRRFEHETVLALDQPCIRHLRHDVTNARSPLGVAEIDAVGQIDLGREKARARQSTPSLGHVRRLFSRRSIRGGPRPRRSKSRDRANPHCQSSE